MNTKEKMTEYIWKHNDKKNQNLKYDFMPELLEIIEKPAHRGTKVIIWTIFVLLVTAVLWAAVTKVDIVVTAQGTVAPVDSVGIVQAKESGYISEVCVVNGQQVKKGDVLLRADTEYIDINMQEITRQIDLLTQENDLYQRIISGEAVTDMDVNSYGSEIRNNMTYLLGEEKMYLDSLEELEGEVLADSKERHRMELLGKIIDNEAVLSELTAQQSQVQKSIENQVITAQTDGYVANMPSGLAGSAVTSGSKLMEIVPMNSAMEVLCYVSNQDIADIKKGMDVSVKLNAYPYSDYGMLEGTVSYISPNSISEEDIQGMYPVKIALSEMREDIKLISGLTGSVEVKTGKRRVLNYLLEPLTEAFRHSMKEK